MTVRLHGTPDDTARRLNRTENVRVIAPTDPDFARLYLRDNDAESINRNLDDTLWLRRAHSVGHDRQLLNLLGYELMVKLALRRDRRRHPRRPSPRRAPTSPDDHTARVLCQFFPSPASSLVALPRPRPSWDVEKTGVTCTPSGRWERISPIRERTVSRRPGCSWPVLAVLGRFQN